MANWIPYPGSGGGGSTGGNLPVKHIVPPQNSVVPVANVAVDAFLFGQRTKGGFLSNPVTAPANLGVNESGVDASGTDTNAATFFIVPGQNYYLKSSSLRVSVISPVSGHVFGGEGYN